MSGHSDVQLSLYDYLDGTLDEKQRESVEGHLRSCNACTEDLRRMQEALSLVGRPERTASDARSEEFWATFATAVEGRIQRRRKMKMLSCRPAGPRSLVFLLPPRIVRARRIGRGGARAGHGAGEQAGSHPRGGVCGQFKEHVDSPGASHRGRTADGQ